MEEFTDTVLTRGSNPAVKAALAALRNRRTPLAESSNLAAVPRTASPSRDAFSTPVRQRKTPSEEPVEHAEQAEEDAEMSEPVQLEWKLTDEAAMVERAKRTGTDFNPRRPAPPAEKS